MRKITLLFAACVMLGSTGIAIADGHKTSDDLQDQFQSLHKENLILQNQNIEMHNQILELRTMVVALLNRPFSFPILNSQQNITYAQGFCKSKSMILSQIPPYELTPPQQITVYCLTP